MLENLVRVGAPSIFPYVNMIGGGTGGLTNQRVMDGIINGAHKFLPFVANGINWCATQGQDVISAHFSGCLMASYTDNGVNKVAHISTGADFGDCKGNWDVVKSNYTNVQEFRPSDFINGVVHDRCYGLITNDGAMYTILTLASQVARTGGGHALADAKVVLIARATELNARRP
jgi:hypothetical protein